MKNPESGHRLDQLEKELDQRSDASAPPSGEQSAQVHAMPLPKKTVSPEEEARSLAAGIQAMVDENYQFVFFWGVPEAGKTHILLSLWHALGTLGQHYQLDYGEGFETDEICHREFSKSLAQFRSHAPAEGTQWYVNYILKSAFKPSSEAFGDLPQVKFAFVEASGERMARHFDNIDANSMGQEDLPMRVDIILRHPHANICHVMVPMYSTERNTGASRYQDENLYRTFDVIRNRRPATIDKDDYLLVLSKWDLAVDRDPHANPLTWLESNIHNTLSRFENWSVKHARAYYMTYISGVWGRVRNDQGREVSFVQVIKNESAEVLAHWLYKAASNTLLFPDKEPKAPPGKWERRMDKFKEFLGSRTIH